jgi:hypothetical protein
MGILLAAVLALAFVACEDGADPVADNGLLDQYQPGDTDEGDVIEPPEDVPAPSDEGDTGPQDAVEDAGEDVPMETRRFTYRAISGVSMGAAALTVASHYPERFDVVGAMGGYVDYRYVGHLMRDMLGGGFCPMDQLLQPDVLADIDNPENPMVFCGNKTPLQPYEYYWDFNHFHYDDDGGTWDRQNYFDVLNSMVFAFGNFMFYNPDNPLLPPGVDPSYLETPNKCANPVRVEYPFNINAEYNPEGTYTLISFCDGVTDVGCFEDDPEQCGKRHPNYRELVGTYDPTQTYDTPVYSFLAVDYNDNGRRDYGEPVVFNLSERWDDVGIDGCANAYEDGQGGCLEDPDGDPDVDANGDDFDLVTNPMGPEGNHEYDEGEPYQDFGIDGVPESISGIKDFGEDDGVFNNNPRYEALITQDARTFFLNADVEELEKHTYFFDGGIRDMLHALTAAMHLSSALESRGLEVVRFEDFAGQPESIFPDAECDNVISIDTPDYLRNLDYSSGGMGKNILVAYGDPNQTEKEALKTRSGKHVGSGCELLLRPTMFFSVAMNRMPNTVRIGDFDFESTIVYSSYYSEILESRRWFAVNLPPGYDTNPDLADVDFPMGIMLPGVGMPLMETIEATRLLAMSQGTGATPRFVLLAPDGQCCYRNTVTQERFCNCYRISGGLRCVERDCRGPHEECEVTDIPRDNMQQECNSGHFFFNQVTNRWGETDMETSRFEDALLEVIDVAEGLYRVKAAEDVEVPVGF